MAAAKMDPIVPIPIPETSKTIIDDMRDLIAKKETDRLRGDATGWQDGGSGLLTLVRDLENDMNNQGFHVSVQSFPFLSQKCKIVN